MRNMLVGIGMLFLLAPGWARAKVEISEDQQELLDSAMEHLDYAEAAFRNKDAAGGPPSAVEQYLLVALSCVFQAAVVYAHDSRELPLTAAEIRAENILPRWPGNPYHNWDPLDWQEYAPDMEFVPGGLVLQRVSEELTTTGLLMDSPSPALGASPMMMVLRPWSFALSINGPAPDYLPGHKVGQHLAWGIVPPATAYIFSRDSFMRKQDYDGHKQWLQRQAAERFP